ncbi:MAG TPA: family 78 glycoside hydrolase catalytic domain, partial [Chitinophagaceae bacterium]
MKKNFIFFLLCIGGIIPGKAAAGHISGPGNSPVSRVEDTRCQSRRDPVGIGESHPTFSWKLSSAERNTMQTGYQLIVASTAEKLEKAPDLWNSGRISSGQNTFVSYAGKSLQSGRKYYWKVKVWINNGNVGVWSASSCFVTGLLNEKEWDRAKWIAYGLLPDSLRVFPGIHGNGDQLGSKAVKRAVIPCFRKDIRIVKQISQAFVYACGLGQYALYLNGRNMDSASLLNPAWSDYTKTCYYNSYDVTSLLRSGMNTVGAIVGNGFLYINRERYRKLTIAAGYPMLRLKMVIRFTDGSSEEIVTDKSWKASPSAITYSGIYGGEDFDAGKVQRGWSTGSFNDAGWRQAVTVPGPGGKMKAQEDYPVVAEEIFHAVHIDSSKKDIRVYDFGQNVSGIIRLKVNGRKGYRVRIIPAELLHADGLPDQDATGKPYYWEYTLKGEGMEIWQPLFSYYGFRYAAVEVFDPGGKQVNIPAVHIDELLSLHTQNGAPLVGDFSCSDTLFNKIFSLIKWGIRNNMSNVATDCPHREKLGWLEETHLMGNSMQYNYDILRFYSKITGDMRDAQLQNGMVPDIAPEYVVFQGGFRDSPEWGSAAVLVPWYIYQWYGDTAILAKNYEMMKRYEDYLGSKADHYLLAYGLGDWFDLGPGSPGVSQLTPLGVTATAFYYYDARIISKTAAALGYTADASRYAALADTIREAFNAKYFDTATKVYATGSQTSYAVPLYFGLAPDEYRKQVLNNLVDSITVHNYALTAGDIGFRYLVQALEEGGEDQLIYRMNNREDVPGYGYQIRKGATALTESWQALREVSNDHMMLGHLMEWLYSSLGGIRQQEGSTGYKKILIAPRFVNGMNWVNARYNSINGLIAVKWRRLNNKNLQLQVEIPANT